MERLSGGIRGLSDWWRGTKDGKTAYQTNDDGTLKTNPQGKPIPVQSGASKTFSLAYEFLAAATITVGSWALRSALMQAAQSGAHSLTNDSLRALDRTPLQPGTVGYGFEDAAFVVLADLSAGILVGFAHPVTRVFTAAVRQGINQIYYHGTRAVGAEEPAENFLQVVANPGYRFVLDGSITVMFFALQGYKGYEGVVNRTAFPSEIMPGTMSAAGTYDPNPFSAAISGGATGALASACSVVFVVVRDRNLVFVAQPEVTLAGTRKAISSGIHAGIEMNRARIAGLVPVPVAQGTLTALMGCMKVQGFSSQDLAIANAVGGAVIHFARVNRWGQARRERELSDDQYRGLVSAMGGEQAWPGSQLERERKTAVQLRGEHRVVPAGYMDRLLETSVPVLGGLAAGMAVVGVQQTTMSVPAGTFSSAIDGVRPGTQALQIILSIAGGWALVRMTERAVAEPLPAASLPGAEVADAPSRPRVVTTRAVASLAADSVAMLAAGPVSMLAAQMTVSVVPIGAQRPWSQGVVSGKVVAAAGAAQHLVTRSTVQSASAPSLPAVPATQSAAVPGDDDQLPSFQSLISTQPDEAMALPGRLVLASGRRDSKHFPSAGSRVPRDSKYWNQGVPGETQSLHASPHSLQAEVDRDSPPPSPPPSPLPHEETPFIAASERRRMIRPSTEPGLPLSLVDRASPPPPPPPRDYPAPASPQAKPRLEALQTPIAPTRDPALPGTRQGTLTKFQASRRVSARRSVLPQPAFYSAAPQHSSLPSPVPPPPLSSPPPSPPLPPPPAFLSAVSKTAKKK